MMIELFLKSSAIYILGLLARSIAIFLVPLYTRYLTAEQYGIVDYFLLFGNVVSVVFSVEISQAIARFYHDLSSEGDRVSYVSTGLIFLCIMYGVYFIFSGVFSTFFIEWLFDGQLSYSQFIFGNLSIISSGIFYYVQNQLKWQMRAKEFVLASLVNMVITALLSWYLLAAKHQGIEAVFLAQLAGNTIGILWSYKYAANTYQWIFYPKALKQMLYFSLPLVFSSIAVFTALYIDRILVKTLLGFDDLGIYAVAYKLASVVGIITIGVNSALTPLIYKHYKEDKMPKEIVRIFELFLLGAFAIFFGSILFSKDIIFLITTEPYYKAYILIPPIIATLFFSNIYIFLPGLVLEKKTKLLAYIAFINAFLNIVLNYIFISLWGLNAAPLASLLGAVGMLIVYIKLSQSYYYIPFRWATYLLGFIGVCFFGYALSYTLEDGTIASFLIKSVFFGIAIFIFDYFLLKTLMIKKSVKKLRTRA